MFLSHLLPTVTHPERDPGNDCRPHSMISRPSPKLLNRVGHTLLLAIAAGHSGPLQAAASALDKLGRLLPDASPEGRMIAVLMSLSIEPTSPTVPTDQRVDAVPPLARSGCQKRGSKAGKTDKTVRPSRKSKPASQPILDAGGRLQASKIIEGVGCVSQSTARQVLGLTCAQMLRLENQKLLTRVQETGLRHVWYPVQQVQRLLNLIDRGVADRGADPEPDDDDDATDPMA